MQVRVLGAAAGGGFPRWNCGCPNCRKARSGSPHVLPCTEIAEDGLEFSL